MSAQTSDIRKQGNLVKMKTMKKKYFVLRENTALGPARLEYYDSEKKFKAGALPKRSVTLSSCFSINNKCDARHRYTLALFTKDSCLTMVCDSEEEQQAWLQSMLDLRNLSADEDNSPVPLFDRIWPVTVKDKGVGSGRHLVPGQYRLCLTNTSLGLVRLNHEEPDITFQLDSIRRCGNKDKFFFMELGRGCKTGEGELWLQVEDEIIALNMHDNILSSMKAINSAAKQPQPQPFRGRSRSNVDKTAKPVNRSQSMQDSSTLPKRSKALSLCDSSSSILRKGPSQNKPELDLRPKTMRSSLLASSPMTGKAISLMVNEADSHRLRTDSMESHASSRGTTSSLSADEMDADHSIARSLTPEAESAYLDMVSASAKPNQVDNYFEMSPGDLQSPYIDMQVNGRSTPTQTQNYLEMSTTPTVRSPKETYLSDGGAYMEMGVSSSASSALSSASSCHELDECVPTDYIDMSPGQGLYLSPVQERLAVDGGYIEMSSPPSSVGNSSLHMRASPSLRPDRVVSYLRDDEAKEDFPKRAYSVGSRSSALDKTLKDTYLDMQVDKVVDQKSLSTPHLVDKRGSQESVNKRKSNRDLSDLFMEMDFNEASRPRTTSTGSSKDFRSRASSSGSKDFRSRTSSFGLEEMRQRTGSFGKKDKISRLAYMLQQNPDRHGDGHRPRTATICQDSLRPRTSSFGSADMRPRSSSQGNARFKERFHKINKDSASKRSCKVTSTESVSSNASSDYLDMQPKPSPSLSSSRKETESEYIAMECVPERLAASPLVRESIDEGYMAMDLSTNQVTHAAVRPKASKSGSKGSSSSESLSSSASQGSSVDAKHSGGKLMGHEYSEMDFSPKDAYMSCAAPPKQTDAKAGKGVEKVTSPSRSDLPQMTQASHSWMHSKHKKKAPEYINLDYSGEKDVREPLLEGDASPAPPQPTPKTVLMPQSGPQPKRPEKPRTTSGSSCESVAAAKLPPQAPKLKVPVPPVVAVPAVPAVAAVPLDPFQLNVKASTKVPEEKPAAPMTSRGSCGSLSSMDAMPSKLSAGPLVELSKSNQLLSAPDAPPTPLLATQLTTTSKTSLVSTEGEIAYAKLDIASSREDPGFLGSSSGLPCSVKSRHSSAEEAEAPSPLHYAEIDFEKTSPN